MKKIFLFLFSMTIMLNVGAQVTVIPAPAGPSYYAVVPMVNNPFIFCTTGYPAPLGWNPINPQSGTWTPNRKYFHYPSAVLYSQICPLGLVKPKPNIK